MASIQALPMPKARTEFGKSGVFIQQPIGIGTMQWGDAWLDKAWVNKGGGTPTDEELDAIFEAVSEKLKVNFFDTAEGYGGGSGERRIADILKRHPLLAKDTVVATKFLPTLWRWTQNSLLDAVQQSNKRLGIPTCPLYFIHTPVHPMPLEHWVRACCVAQDKGYIQAMGLSNCNAEQVRRAVKEAAKHGKRIAANQILYSLLDYNSKALQEMQTVCGANDITIIGYSPVGQGLLVDALTQDKFEGIRMAKMTGLTWLDPDFCELRQAIHAIAASKGRPMAQVCIKWSIAKGAVPLVGVRSLRHLSDIAGALDSTWALSSDEMSLLDRLALKRSTFEKPRWRRAFFTGLLSVLMMMYSVTDWLYGLPAHAGDKVYA
mmetsp:Transcript_30520/g.74897  ORF Transcript_30520/g.74897 Transcript_30520/m.74897 type:complete len:376 (+) Transcript_30520:214-1341(+)